MKMRLVGTEFFRADRRAYMTKLIVVFAILRTSLKTALLLKTKPQDKREFRLPPRCKWDQRSFGILRSVEW